MPITPIIDCAPFYLKYLRFEPDAGISTISVGSLPIASLYNCDNIVQSIFLVLFFAKIVVYFQTFITIDLFCSQLFFYC